MNKDALTAVEVAEMLQIAKNTVYALVKRGELPCYMVGRKMRFTYDDVQNYINRSRNMAPESAQGSLVGTEVGLSESDGQRQASGVETPDSNASTDNVFRICGNDDILKELTHRMMEARPGLNVECVQKGSYDALTMLYRDRVSAAASHMWDAETDTYNTSYIKAFLPGCPTVTVHVCNRMEGFYVAEGNPKQIKSWEDLGREDVVVANREPGAGSRILADVHLTQLGIDARGIKGYDRPYRTHLSVAGAVSKGDADIGIGPEKTALGTRGVSFVPLQEESYDLVIKKRDFESDEVQLMLQILRSDDFQEEFRYISGYNVSGMGEILP